MDKTWMKLPRNSRNYLEGLKKFLDFAFSKENTGVNGMILCPCKTCKNGICLPREEVEVHLKCSGFINGYTQWIAHGEVSDHETNNSSYNEPNDGDNMEEMLHDAFGVTYDDNDIEKSDGEEVEEPNSEAKCFYKLVDDSQQELWPGCKKFSKLSFLVRLYHIKCLGKISNKIFTMLLELLTEAFPEGVKLPKSNYEARKVIEELGLGYKKYDACPNDCTLYWGKDENRLQCETCGCTRWMVSDGDSTGEKRKVPHKVLWHFPLIGRLQRLFMSSKTASSMRWHAENRTKDGNMRHPADSPAWQSFDYKNPEFAKDPRNVRLGLATDGFNPFKNMNVSHSTWPVILIPYNLPPWMCMKQPYFMMSLLIPGPLAPGNNIDVYLQPLIQELQILWDVGVDTYDASRKKNFKMRASLLWTISDFPGYANVSGWGTKGKYACPGCNKNTESMWLKYCGKHCYMGHRRFLEKHHPFRNNLKSFDGKREIRNPPSRLSGSEILADLEGFEMKFGKLVSNNTNLPFNWKKKSIFFNLPYWKDNLLPHNLDVMHITKNVCESIIGTLLNIDGKSKDHLKSRLDLKEMGIRQELHPVEFGDGTKKFYLPHPCFVMNRKEKDKFLRTLKTVKVPDGYASNISRCVQTKPPKLSGLKSHDYHILMQQLLPLSIRKILPKSVRVPLINLSRYFRDLCSKVLKPQDLFSLEKDICLILCQLEQLYPPSFFDIMVHLIVHLANEARIAGPVHYRWMFPIERYLCTLKSYVRNKSRPEGSIAEGYIAEESLNFCSLYFGDGVETRFNRMSRNDDGFRVETSALDVFSNQGRHLKKGKIVFLDDDTLRKAHQYVIFNSHPVKKFIDEHYEIVEKEHPRSTKHEIERIHVGQFASWFAQRACSLDDGDPISCDLKLLAKGPISNGIYYNKFLVNGFRFHTKEVESRRKTQNSGVVVNATTSSFSSSKDRNPIMGEVAYYGVLKNIVELDYTSNRKVVLFDCDWVSQGKRIKQDEDGFTMVNFSNVKPHNEPFILASQAKQVFYVEDVDDKGWHVAIQSKARDVYDMDPIDSFYINLQSEVCSALNVDQVHEDLNWAREGTPGFVVES